MPPPRTERHSISRAAVRQRSEVVYEIPQQARADMRVPARIYADAELLAEMLQGDTLEQLTNVATLPGIAGYVYGMPDMHQGYGFPVGAVAATAADQGVISPGGVGFDINCGVRLLALPVMRKELGGHLEGLLEQFAAAIPAGAGRQGALTLQDDELDAVLERGCEYLIRERGLGWEADLAHIESGGCLADADAGKVSTRAKERGRGQLGTLGSGNHFLELQWVDRIADEKGAAALGLRKEQLTVLIHTGSRGLGHQVCTDYVRLMDLRLADYGITLPDRQLSCAPLSSPEGQDYHGAMCAAANFAWSNRQLISHRLRECLVRVLGGRCPPERVRLVYDVAHNIAKLEQHDGQCLCVHRKGATRAFGPGNPETPAAYQAVGQPVFIPGSMGTRSWVLLGTLEAEQQSLGTVCHGAGRAMSRTAARKRITGQELRRQLKDKGILVRGASNRGLAEEAPFAYKDVAQVVEVVAKAGLARPVARLRPIGVVKG